MSTSDFLPARDDQKLSVGAWSRTYTLSGITVVDNTTWHARIVRNKGDVQATGTLVSPTVTVNTGANTVTFSLTATQVAALIGAGAAKFPGYWSVYYDTLAVPLVAGSFVIDRTATNSGSAGAATLTYAPTTGAALTVTSSASPVASAISFTPTGTIAATNVQTAVAEVATDAAATYAAIAGDLTGTAAIPRIVSDSVRYVSATGSDSNDGLTWGKAYATVTAALTALGTTGGTIMVGAGSFAPFVIDGTVSTKKGYRIIGQGPYLSKIVASSAGQHAVQVSSQDGDSMIEVKLEGLQMTGTTGTGCGLFLGGGTTSDWVQMGAVHVSDCVITGNGSDGIRAFNVNYCLFTNVYVRSNLGYGIKVTGNSADGSGTVVRGNTCMFVNCAVSANTLGGWLFDQCGNTWTIIGGETDTHASTYGLTVNPGNNFAGLNLLGVHMERNWRDLKIGDGTTGPVKNVKIDGCFFDLSTGGYNIVFTGARNCEIRNCLFGGSDTGMTAHVWLAGASSYSDQVEFANTTHGGSSPLIKDSAGTTYDTATGLKWGGRSRIVNTHSTQADTFTTALSRIEDRVGSIAHVELVNTSGSCTDWIGTGSPESVVTANIGSTYRRLDGSAATTLYVKESGASNTGWVAHTATAQSYGNDEIALNVLANGFSATNWGTFAQDSACFGAQYRASSSALNDQLIFAPVWFRGGTYRLVTNFTQRTDGGIITYALSTDNSTYTDLTTVDTYGASNVKARRSTVTGLAISAGLYYVRLKMATKNASSSAYIGIIEGSILFSRTGA